MNKDQFSHIAMIAQGEFVRLVNATTQQRIKILKGIFNTSLYEKMGEHLKRLETSLLNSIHTDECRAKDHIKNIDFNVLEADEEDFGVPLILNETNKESLRLLEERNRTVYIKYKRWSGDPTPRTGRAWWPSTASRSRTTSQPK